MVAEHDLSNEDDELLKLGKGLPKDDEIDITPMIDIVFLLLIFFVVASKMDPQQAKNLPRADHGLAVAADDAAIILVRDSGGGRAAVLRQDGTSFTEDPELQEVEMLDYLNQEFDMGKNKIFVFAEEDVRSGEVSRIRKAIGGGFPDLSTIFIGVMEMP